MARYAEQCREGGATQKFGGKFLLSMRPISHTVVLQRYETFRNDSDRQCEKYWKQELELEWNSGHF